MPKPKASSTRPAIRRPAPGTSLAVVDNEPIRHEACVRYEKLHEALQKLEVEMNSHHRVDLPAYQAWLNKHFEKEVGELRALQNKLLPIKELLQDVDDFIKHGGLTPKQAYQEVKKARAQVDGACKAKGAMEDDGEDEKKSNDFMDDLEEAFAEEFGRSATKRNGPRPDALASALKHAYREIVRVLHPDHLAEPTLAQQELWHQAQECYVRKDLTGLEVLLGLCEAGDGGAQKINRISLLRAMAQKTEQRMGVLRFQLAGLRKQASWQFTRNKNFNQLYRRVEIELAQTIRQTHEDLCKGQERISNLEAACRPFVKTKPKAKSRTRAKMAATA